MVGQTKECGNFSDQYAKDAGLYISSHEGHYERRSPTPTPSAGGDFDMVDDDEDDVGHHDRFKAERDGGAPVLPKKSSLSESDKLNVALDDLVHSGKIAVPNVPDKSTRSRSTKNLFNRNKPQNNNQQRRGSSSFKSFQRNNNNNGTSANNLRDAVHKINPWVNGYGPNANNRQVPQPLMRMRSDPYNRRAPQHPMAGPSHMGYPNGNQQQFPMPGTSQMDPQRVPAKMRIYNAPINRQPAPQVQAPSRNPGVEANEIKIKEMAGQLLAKMTASQTVLKNVCEANPEGGLRDYVVAVAERNFMSKYNMEIQKQIAEIQKKPLMVKNGVPVVTTSDGTEGVEDLHEFMRGTGIRMNTRVG